MILGVGVDLLNIDRVGKLYSTFPIMFPKRVLSDGELEIFYNGVKNPVNFLAKKFSVKEAISKAIGVGIGSHISFHDLTIAKDDFGKPNVVLSSKAKSFLGERYHKDMNCICIDISITDEGCLVNCFAVVSYS